MIKRYPVTYDDNIVGIRQEWSFTAVGTPILLTLLGPCCRLMEKGALSVTTIVTHGLFSRDAVDKINHTPELESVLVSLAAVFPESRSSLHCMSPLVSCCRF